MAVSLPIKVALSDMPTIQPVTKPAANTGLAAPAPGLGTIGASGEIASLFVPDTSRPKTEEQLQAEWKRLQESAKKARADGFMGRVVMPGEGNYEDWKQLNQYEMMRNPSIADSAYANFDMTGIRDLRKEKANTMATITTDQQLQKEVGALAGAGIPAMVPAQQTVQPGELQSTTGTQLQPTGQQAPTATASQVGLQAPIPTPSAQNIGQIPSTSLAQVTPQIGTMQAAQITQPVQVDLTGVQAGPSAGAIGTAATQQLDPQATTQYQLGQLMNSIQQGQPMPPWAAPAVRKIGGIMQARGLGGSSMAAAAMTQAVLESGITIAADDAKKYATIQLANLNNQQQMALSNAATYAAMDKANLNARLTAAVTNAQSLLATETKNLDAQQQANTLSYNALTQGIFKDAAEENARQQFNAKNELQVEQFFAELGSQVETANANRMAAMEQFNAGEENAMNQFNSAMADNREKFNANMQFAVDQSNTQWRRQINTANTAAQNEANRQNVQNAFNASQNALNNLWQQYRDNAAWNFQKSESQLQRQHEVGIMAMEFANSEKIYDKQQKDNLAAGIGNWIAAWIAS